MLRTTGRRLKSVQIHALNQFHEKGFCEQTRVQGSGETKTAVEIGAEYPSRAGRNGDRLRGKNLPPALSRTGAGRFHGAFFNKAWGKSGRRPVNSVQHVSCLVCFFSNGPPDLQPSNCSCSGGSA